MSLKNKLPDYPIELVDDPHLLCEILEELCDKVERLEIIIDGQETKLAKTAYVPE